MVMAKSVLFRLCLFTITVIMLTACGGSKGSKSSDSSSSASTSSTTVTSAQLQGLWKGSCFPGDTSGSLQDFLIISGNQISWRSAVSLSNATCATPDYDLDVISNFVLGTQSTAVPVATNVSFTTQSGAITLHTAALVTQANTNNMCGFNNWALNVKKDVALDCVSGAPSQTYNDIINITGSTLMLGDQNGTALDPSFAYQKQ